jgi:hypothetical protein
MPEPMIASARAPWREVNILREVLNAIFYVLRRAGIRGAAQGPAPKSTAHSTSCCGIGTER